MAGINRLGKAPPRPGSLRPVDPNKYVTQNMYSEDAEGDADYMRMVQDIEDAQNQQGWLFGRGAFDKGDLLYLRDEEEKRRYAELNQRESEAVAYQALRARVEAAPDGAQGIGVARLPRRDRGSAKPPATKLLAKVVKLKTTKDGDGGQTGDPGPPAKRLKAEANSAVWSSAPPQSDGQGQDSGDEADGLAGLLGDYGSDSDEDGTGAQEGQPEAAEPSKGAQHSQHTENNAALDTQDTKHRMQLEADLSSDTSSDASDDT